jgi:hypothetical protein
MHVSLSRDRIKLRSRFTPIAFGEISYGISDPGPQFQVNQAYRNIADIDFFF